MFDSVLHKGAAPQSRFGAGTFISLAVHGALIAAVAWFSSRPPAVEEAVSEVKFFAAPPPPPPPPPPPAGRSTPKVDRKVERKPKTDVLVQPKEIPVEKPKEAEQPQSASDEPAGEAGGVEGGVEGGVAGGVVGGVIGGVVGGTLGGTGTDVVPFGEGMTRPEVDRAVLVDDLYTREAREAHVEGMMIVKCNVMPDGTIRNCRVIKPLPHLSEAVVARLHSMKATPGTFQGRPVAIDYVFNFKFQMPR